MEPVSSKPLLSGLPSSCLFVPGAEFEHRRVRTFCWICRVRIIMGTFLKRRQGEVSPAEQSAPSNTRIRSDRVACFFHGRTLFVLNKSLCIREISVALLAALPFAPPHPLRPKIVSRKRKNRPLDDSTFFTACGIRHNMTREGCGAFSFSVRGIRDSARLDAAPEEKGPSWEKNSAGPSREPPLPGAERLPNPPDPIFQHKRRESSL